jgi:hypothetical protein
MADKLAAEKLAAKQLADKLAAEELAAEKLAKQLVGKIVNVSSKGFKDLKKPVPARNYTAVVIAYEPELPFEIVRRDSRAVSTVVVDYPGPSGVAFQFDTFEPEPVTVGRATMRPVDSGYPLTKGTFTKEEHDKKWLNHPNPPINCFKEGDDPDARFTFCEFKNAPYMQREAVKITLHGLTQVAVKNVSSNKKVFYQKGTRYLHVIGADGKLYKKSNVDTFVEFGKVYKKSSSTRESEYVKLREYANAIDVVNKRLEDEQNKNLEEHEKVRIEKVRIVERMEYTDFIELKQNNFVVLEPEDKLLLGDHERILPKDRADYTVKVRKLCYEDPPGAANYANVKVGLKKDGPRLHNYLVKIGGTIKDVPGGVAAYVKGVHTMLESKGSWTAGPDKFSVDGFMVVPRAAITEMGGTPSLKRKGRQ